MELNTLAIENAAAQKLSALKRTSFSGEQFSSQEVSAISHAIAAAIAEYDRQRKQDT